MRSIKESVWSRDSLYRRVDCIDASYMVEKLFS